jgi:hypothetical protein
MSRLLCSYDSFDRERVPFVLVVDTAEATLGLAERWRTMTMAIKINQKIKKKDMCSLRCGKCKRRGRKNQGDPRNDE